MYSLIKGLTSDYTVSGEAKHVLSPQSVPVSPSLLEDINTQLSVGASVSPVQSKVSECHILREGAP